MTHDEFIAERRSGIGGSDAHHLFSLEPYGCQRQLWYDKTGIAPDYCHGESTEAVFERGHELEPIIAAKYARETGRNVTTHQKAIRHPEHPELLVHVDRFIEPNQNCPDPSRPGVLEIKSVNREIFYQTKRDGLPQGYILQLQHAMLVTGTTWGAFAVLWPDAWKMMHWDVARDDSLCETVCEVGVEFWQRVQSGMAPDRLDASDKRCQRCLWRTSCQGAALLESTDDVETTDNSLVDITSEFLELRDIRDEAAELFDACAEKLKAKLGDRQSVDTIGARIYFRPQTSMRLDGTALKKAMPEIYSRYVKPSVSRPLRVFAR